MKMTRKVIGYWISYIVYIQESNLYKSLAKIPKMDVINDKNKMTIAQSIYVSLARKHVLCLIKLIVLTLQFDMAIHLEIM